MGTWTTHVRIPVDSWRTSPDVDELIIGTERKVRAALRGAASDPDAEIAVWWHVIIPGPDPTQHDGATEATPYGRGSVAITWRPGEPIPDGADEIACRGRAVT